MKYRPSFPGRFAFIEDAAPGARTSSPGTTTTIAIPASPCTHTAADVHHGRTGDITATRAGILATAYAAHPERFVCKPPAPAHLPAATWIDQPPAPEGASVL
jgi:putative transposase